MEPSFKSSNYILASSLPYLLKNPKAGDVVVLKKEKLIIKRIDRIKDKKFFVRGDNLKASTDSRNFGWIKREEIVGKVIYKI